MTKSKNKIESTVFIIDKDQLINNRKVMHDVIDHLFNKIEDQDDANEKGKERDKYCKRKCNLCTLVKSEEAKYDKLKTTT